MTSQFDRCLFILADGARADVVEHLLDTGDLPHISRHIVEPGGYRRAATVFPSTTGPAYLPFITGRYPGPGDIPGIRWFNSREFGRSGVWGRRSRRSYVGPASYHMNGDLRPGIPTIFDCFQRPANVFSAVNRGVGFWGNTTKVIRAAYWLFAHWTDRWHHVDQAAERLVMASLYRDSDFIFAVFPGVDEFAHLEGFTDNVTEAYRSVDRAVGSVVSWLEERGLLERTLIVLSSDHGLSETSVHFDPGDYLDDLGYRTLHYPLAYRADANAAYMVSGNGMGQVSFRLGEHWSGRTCIEDVLAAPHDPVGALLGREEIELVAGQSADGSIRVMGNGGEGRITCADGRFTYELRNGDPLGIGSISDPVDDRAALNLTFESDYPDAIVQLWQIFESDRCGDIVLSARKGCDLRSSKYENPHHKASHGSLVREHMLVPLAMNAAIAEGPARTVDAFPTMLSLTGRSMPAPVDGRDLSL